MSKGSLHTLLTDENANYSLFDLLGMYVYLSIFILVEE